MQSQDGERERKQGVRLPRTHEATTGIEWHRQREWPGESGRAGRRTRCGGKKEERGRWRSNWESAGVHSDLKFELGLPIVVDGGERLVEIGGDETRDWWRLAAARPSIGGSHGQAVEAVEARRVSIGMTSFFIRKKLTIRQDAREGSWGRNRLPDVLSLKLCQLDGPLQGRGACPM